MDTTSLASADYVFMLASNCAVPAMREQLLVYELVSIARGGRARKYVDFLLSVGNSAVHRVFS